MCARDSEAGGDLGDVAMLAPKQHVLADTERQGLEALYRTLRPSLLRLFARNRASSADAEDMTQETFLRFARAGAGGGDLGQPGAYLRQIGRNLIRDRARAPLARIVSVDSPATERAVSDENTLGRLEARDSLRRIEAAIERLKPKTREIFLAHRLDGMSYAQIAEQTGLSVKGVEKQMAKAIAQVRRAMDRDA